MNDLLSLQDLFNKKIFRIPDYQRGYSWSTQQLEEFWSDVINLLPDKEHYTGMISLKKLDKNYTSNWISEKWLIDDWGYDVYHIVDGQQRLTTFIILINEIVNYYKKSNPDKELDKIFVNSIPLNKIIEDYLVTTKPDSEGVIKTYKFGYEVDNPSYEFFKTKILESGEVGNDIETFYTLNLERSKLFFEKQIELLVNEKGIQALENLFKKLSQKMMFNMYYIDNDFNVFIAFETMNNRGKKLSYLELLKNRLIYLSTLFNVEEDNKLALRQEINETWKIIYGNLGKNKTKPLNDDEFLQAHWMIYFGYTRTNQITFNSFLLNDYFTQQNIFNDTYVIPSESINEQLSDEIIIENDDVVENVIENKSDRKKDKLTMGTIKNYINSLKELIPYWYLMHNPKEVNNNEIRMYLERINRLGFVNFKPLIMVILANKSLDDEKKIELLKAIERFIFMHYRLNGYFSTYKNSYFFNLAHYYYFGERTFDEVLKECNTIDFLSENKVVNMSGIINKFERLFKNYDGFYSWASIRYVLYEYERHLATGKGTIKIFPEDIFKKDEKDHYSIEHIYPQTPTEEDWVNKYDMFDDEQKKRLTGTLGNLLPLSQSINSSLQNYTFELKKTRNPRGYLNGSYSEIEVSQNQTWTSKEILQRGLNIISFMEKEWDFIIPNKAERIKFLGLPFLIEPGDENIDVTVPINKELEPKLREVEFSEEQYKKLIANTNPSIIKIFEELDNYLLSLDSKISKHTTTVYLSYSTTKNFIDVWFHNNSLKFILMTGEYDDPKGKVIKLAESYKWTNDNYITVDTTDDLEYVKNILKQSYLKELNKNKGQQ